MAVTGFASGIKRRDAAHNTGPIGASTSLYRMAIVMRDSSGNLFNGATASGYVGVGVAAMNDTGGVAAGTDPNVWANGSGNAGDFTAKYHHGIHGPFANSGTSITAGMEGDVCYIVDNVTLHATSNGGARSPAAIIHRVDSSGVWAEFDEMKVKLALAIGADVTFTQTYPTADATVAAATVAAQTALTDNSGGATADGTIGVITAAAAITDSSTGVDPGNDTIAAITNPDLSAWNGSTDPSSAQATAIGAAVTAMKAAIAQIVAKMNTDRTAIIAARDAVKELSTTVNLHTTAINAVAADDLDNRQSINKIIDVLQAKGLAA